MIRVVVVQNPTDEDTAAVVVVECVGAGDEVVASVRVSEPHERYALVVDSIERRVSSFEVGSRGAS